jgi:hypothetical protein
MKTETALLVLLIGVGTTVGWLGWRFDDRFMQLLGMGILVYGIACVYRISKR